jgi:hypothetical protein
MGKSTIAPVLSIVLVETGSGEPASAELVPDTDTAHSQVIGGVNVPHAWASTRIRAPFPASTFIVVAGATAVTVT